SCLLRNQKSSLCLSMVGNRSLARAIATGSPNKSVRTVGSGLSCGSAQPPILPDAAQPLAGLLGGCGGERSAVLARCKNSRHFLRSAAFGISCLRSAFNRARGLLSVMLFLFLSRRNPRDVRKDRGRGRDREPVRARRQVDRAVARGGEVGARRNRQKG